VDDATCFRMIQQGGEPAKQAVAVLYQHYAPHFTSYVMRYCNCTSAMAQDAVQDAFVNIVRHLHSGDAGPSAADKGSAWMWTIVRNAAISLHRKPEHRHLVLLGEAGTQDDEEQHVELWRATPQESSLSPEDADCVRRAWRAFTADHPQRAEALKLAILEEWSGEDMAQYLGRSYRATLEYLSQCRKVLRTYLQRWCGDEPQITQAR
jgi:RNA polymerase sigma factor (sigma-70 family)